MKVQELLKQRYEVIAYYPNTKFQIGDILTKYDFETSKEGAYCYVTNTECPLQGRVLKKEFAETMPHLFKKLNWWDYININNTPDYLKTVVNSINHKEQILTAFKALAGNFRNGGIGFSFDKNGFITGFDNIRIECFMPVSEEEYNLITNGVGK